MHLLPRCQRDPRQSPAGTWPWRTSPAAEGSSCRSRSQPATTKIDQFLLRRVCVFQEQLVAHWPSPGWCRPGRGCGSCTGRRSADRASTAPAPGWRPQKVRHSELFHGRKSNQEVTEERNVLLLNPVAVSSGVEGFADEVAPVGSFSRTLGQAVHAWVQRNTHRTNKRNCWQEANLSRSKKHL